MVERIIKDSTHTSDTIVKQVTKEHYNLKVDTFFITSNDTSKFASNYIYQIKDSLLEATIIAKSEDRPQIDFNYKIKNYTISDTIRIKETLTKEIIKNKMYFGSEVVVKPMFSQVYLGADFVHKKGHLLGASAGYDLQNNNPVFKLQYKRLISFKK
jgi:hypothetical protein